MRRNEECLCLGCQFKLPKTRYKAGEMNAAEAVFRGRVVLEMATAFLYFTKSGLAQRLIHALKYKGNDALGIWLGEQYGHDLMKDKAFIKPDCLTCVPLHRSKLRMRGYNQSEKIAMGMAKAMALPYLPDILEKLESTESQTRKGRFMRWQNSQGGFKALKTNEARVNVIGLVDDVLTTGATLEACALELQKAGYHRVSLFALCVSIR